MMCKLTMENKFVDLTTIFNHEWSVALVAHVSVTQCAIVILCTFPSRALTLTATWCISNHVWLSTDITKEGPYHDLHHNISTFCSINPQVQHLTPQLSIQQTPAQTLFSSLSRISANSTRQIQLRGEKEVVGDLHEGQKKKKKKEKRLRTGRKDRVTRLPAVWLAAAQLAGTISPWVRWNEDHPEALFWAAAAATWRAACSKKPNKKKVRGFKQRQLQIEATGGQWCPIYGKRFGCKFSVSKKKTRERKTP